MEHHDAVRRSDLTSLWLRGDVVLFLVARFLWIAAAQIANVAVGWLVYDATHSAWALGFVGLAAFAPKLLLAIPAGLVADRFDRRYVAAASLLADGVGCVGLLLIALPANVPVLPIYLMFMLHGAARAFVAPATQALIANLVPRTQLSQLMGLSSGTAQLATICGPAMGGLLFLGGDWAPFAVAAGFYLLASLMQLMVRAGGHMRSRTPVAFADAFAGLAFIGRRPVIFGAISLDMFCVLLGGATALLPMIAADILHVGPQGLGILRSMPALGALILGLVLALLPIRRLAGPKLFVATIVFGLATIGLGLSTQLYLTLFCLWILGASDVFSVVIRQTLVQSDTPDDMRGRVAAVNSLFVGASNELGEFESGVTAAIFGLVPAILIGGVGTIAVSLLWAVLFPSLRRRDQLVEGAAPVAMTTAA